MNELLEKAEHFVGHIDAIWRDHKIPPEIDLLDEDFFGFFGDGPMVVLEGALKELEAHVEVLGRECRQGRVHLVCPSELHFVK